MKTVFALGVLGVVLMASACSSTGFKGTWNVVSMAQGDGTMADPVPADALTLTFADDAISGSAGCNNFSGSGDWPSEGIAIASTLKACEPDLMQQESLYLTHLTSATSAEADEFTMTVKDADGNVTLVLQLPPK